MRRTLRGSVKNDLMIRACPAPVLRSRRFVPTLKASWSLAVILCPTSKSEASHRRREAALKKWLEEDTKNLRPKGVGSSGVSSFARILLKMGRETGKSNEFHWGRRRLPKPKPSGCATITSPRSIRRTSVSAAPSCSGTSLEFMNVTCFRLWRARPGKEQKVC